MEDITIVSYKKGDYQTLISLWERSGLPYKPKGRDGEINIEKEVAGGKARFLFAIHNNDHIGSALITHDGRKGWINRVCIIPEFRKNGIARKLVKAGEKWLQDQGIGIYACLIEGYNDNSFEAFKKMGYIPFEGIHYLTKRIHPDI